MIKSSYSAKLFREIKSLSITIEERDEGYGFKYNGSHYYIHVDEAKGTLFLYKKMVLQLVYNIHDNVVHHRCNIPRENFFKALEHHKNVKDINGFWSPKGSYVYTDIIPIDGELPLTNVLSELLAKLESVYQNIQEDITYYIME